MSHHESPSLAGGIYSFRDWAWHNSFPFQPIASRPALASLRSSTIQIGPYTEEGAISTSIGLLPYPKSPYFLPHKSTFPIQAPPAASHDKLDSFAVEVRQRPAQLRATFCFRGTGFRNLLVGSLLSVQASFVHGMLLRRSHKPQRSQAAHNSIRP